MSLNIFRFDRLFNWTTHIFFYQ